MLTMKTFALLLLNGFNCMTINGLSSPRLLLIRHGRSEMNEYLSQAEQTWGDPDFIDPELCDTPLTSVGLLQASQLNIKLRQSPTKIDLLISSPLTRALQTAETGFDNVVFSQRMVSPLASERVFLSSDTGSQPQELVKRFPGWDIENTVGDTWWYTSETEEWRPPGNYACPGEPAVVFYDRMRTLLEFLKSREENSIALVAHWGVIRALSGASLNNCEMHAMNTADLPSEPHWEEEDR